MSCVHTAVCSMPLVHECCLCAVYAQLYGDRNLRVNVAGRGRGGGRGGPRGRGGGRGGYSRGGCRYCDYPCVCIQLTTPSMHPHCTSFLFIFFCFALCLAGGYSQGMPMPQGPPGGPPPVGTGYLSGPGPYPSFGSPPSRDESWGDRRGRGGDRGKQREGRGKAHEEFKEANPR